MHRGEKRLRPPAEDHLIPVVARHAIASVDPAGAKRLSKALVGHIVSPRGYASALRRYTSFCKVRCLDPFPADALWIASYIEHLSSSVMVSSMGTYLSSIRYFQEMEGFKWTLSGNEMVRRMRRFVKRRFPAAGKRLKFPLSISVLKSIFPLMPGWPNWSIMAHDDLMIIAAATIAVCAFLRGGEFLVYPGSRRGVLKFEDVFTAPTASGQSVHVQIRQPKNMWWLSYALAQCFDPGGADLNFGPVVALVNYHKYSGVPFSPEGPAFVMACGAPLGRDFFVARISALLCMANIEFRDSEGNLAKVLATSCRAGGVRSALDAKIDVATIQLLGRWRSMAWSSYALHSTSSLQTARQ